jgi:hypothetical protein
LYCGNIIGSILFHGIGLQFIEQFSCLPLFRHFDRRFAVEDPVPWFGRQDEVVSFDPILSALRAQPPRAPCYRGLTASKADTPTFHCMDPLVENFPMSLIDVSALLACRLS